MLRHMRIFLPALVLAGMGCGGGDSQPPPWTAEQQRAIQEEDKKVELEEGGGKPQPKGKPTKK